MCQSVGQASNVSHSMKVEIEYLKRHAIADWECTNVRGSGGARLNMYKVAASTQRAYSLGKALGPLAQS